MPFYNPKDKINKLNEYFDLLDELFHLPQGYDEDELLHRITHNKGVNSPEPSYIFDILLRYDLIVESNDFQPRYILGSPYRTLLEHLYQDSQPVNSAIIRGYIEVLKQCSQNLRDAYEQKSTILTLKHLQRLGREMELMKQTSARNCEGVINEVRKLRLNNEKLRYKERLSEVNRLWDEYLEPLLEMIMPTGAFGQVMQQLRQTLDTGKTLFISTVELQRQFSSLQAPWVQLQEQARNDLNEASTELAPLRKKLIEESRLMEASDLLFKHIEQDKLNDYPTLSLGRKLTHERQVSLYGLRSWLSDLWSIQSEPASFQFDESETQEPDPLETDALRQLLADMPANTDLIDYFQQQYGNLSANQILRAISIATLHQQDIPIGVLTTGKQYQINGQLWQGYSFQKLVNTEKSK